MVFCLFVCLFVFNFLSFGRKKTRKRYLLQHTSNSCLLSNVHSTELCKVEQARPPPSSSPSPLQITISSNRGAENLPGIYVVNLKNGTFYIHDSVVGFFHLIVLYSNKFPCQYVHCHTYTWSLGPCPGSRCDPSLTTPPPMG